MSASYGRNLSVRGCSARGMVACTLAAVVFSLFMASRLNAQVEFRPDAQHAPRFFLMMNGGTPEPMDASRVPVLRQRLALDLEGVTLKQAITTISRQSGLIIWYSDDVLRRNTPVHLRADAITVAAALTDVLMDAGVDVVFSRDGTASLVKRTATPAPAQVGIIAGRATDSTSREGIGSVTIAVEGTRLSTTTAVDGAFTIRGVPAGNRTITARRLGFVRQARAVTVADNESTTVDFVLVQAPTTLTEVVTTATGEQRRVELGHVVGRINADSIVKAAPVSSIGELLNGRVPGLRVQTPTGLVGGDVSLRIRTPNSIQLGADPIVIVDGIRYTNLAAERISLASVNAVERTSPLNDLNPNEIETIEIVKGPSAATLYGTDAANGVIVITTKRGFAGPSRWNAYFKGASTEIPTLNVPAQYWGWTSSNGVPSFTSNCTLDLVVSGSCTQDSITVARSPLNDQQASIFGSKPRWEFGTNVGGGSDVFRYFVAADFERATGPIRLPRDVADSLRSVRGELADETLEPNAFSKINLRSNATIVLGKGAEMQVSAGYSSRANRTFGVNFFNPYARAIEQGSPHSPYGREGIAEFFSMESTERSGRFFGHVSGRWAHEHWLSTRAMFGLDAGSISRASVVRRDESPGLSLGRGEVADDRTRQIATTSEAAATARFMFARLSSRTTLGGQYVRTLNDMLAAAGQDLPPGGTSIGEAAIVQSDQAYSEQVTLGAYVEQVVGLNERLFLTGALRADGASTFGRDYDAVIYPKAAVSWLISEESFIPSIGRSTELRVRYAYGRSGQQPRPEWARPGYSVRRVFVGGTIRNAYQVTTLGNRELRPERVSEHEFGFDASVLARRMDMSLTWFHRRAVDQIVGLQLPPGLFIQQTNLGLTTGRGFEAQMHARVVTARSVKWDVQVQHSVQRTTLNDLGGAPENPVEYGGYREGYSIGARFQRPLIGFEDANGDGIISSTEIQFGDSLLYAGESSPPHTTTFTTSLAVFRERLRISALFERRSGFTQMSSLARQQCANNLCRGMVDRTTPLDDQARSVAARAFGYQWLEPGDFTRFREVSFVLDLPARIAGSMRAKTATLSLQGRNIALWTSYGGIDPESGSASGAIQEFGIPQARSWALRIDMGF